MSEQNVDVSNVWIMMLKKIAISAIVFIGLGITAFQRHFSKPIQISDLTLPQSEPEGYEPIVVLELFTSQGCSSCPPADILLDKVKNEFDNSVFPLSYHVDYWNYIGWIDPLSKSKYAEKQRAYNIKFKNRSNYTPQIVVNGMEHFGGSNSSKLHSAINNSSKEKTTNKINLTKAWSDKKSVSFEYGILGSKKDKTLRAILVLDQRTTDVQREENRNRKLTNSNIVVAEKTISVTGLGGKSFILIPEIVNSDEKISLVLLLENKDYEITGAAKSTLPR